MFLYEQIVKQLHDGTWETDCIHMELVQNVDVAPSRFVGQGFLRQQADGTIRYRLYPQNVSGVHPGADGQPLGLPGRLIDTHCYYRLEARTHNGMCWKAAQTLAEVSSSFHEDGTHYLVSGNANEVSFSRDSPWPQETFLLTMAFFTDVTIPFNLPIKTMHNVAGRQQQSFNLNIAQFTTAFGQFHISSKSGMLIVEVEAAVAFPEHFESRIVEALGLVLATPLNWNAISRVENGIETLCMQGRPYKVNSLLPRPVTGPYRVIDTTGDVWRLFERFLAFVCTHNDSSYHPCSRHLFAVLEASAGYITSRGLALGVAAEGIVKVAFPTVGTPMEGMEAMVQPLKDHCLAWPNMPQGELGESLKSRLPGMIAQLKNVSTKDKFHALAVQNVIDAVHVKAWDKLRNTLAHGVTPGSRDVRKLVDLCNKVTMLIYHLIFRCCHYEGSYVDYSTYGYPQRYYRGRPVTEEEKAVAAYYLSAKNMHQDDVACWYAGEKDLCKGIY